MRAIELQPGQRVTLPRHRALTPALHLCVDEGVGHLSAPFGMSLAFCSPTETPWLWLLPSTVWALEALTPMQLQLEAVEATPSGADLIAEWQWHLHLARHPVGAEQRVSNLLRLLILHFGRRVPQGYRLPFALGHGRIAELIGVTRSTVTRQFSLLRQNGQLTVDQAGHLLAAPELIEMHELVANITS